MINVTDRLFLRLQSNLAFKRKPESLLLLGKSHVSFVELCCFHQCAHRRHKLFGSGGRGKLYLLKQLEKLLTECLGVGEIRFRFAQSERVVVVGNVVFQTIIFKVKNVFVHVSVDVETAAKEMIFNKR